MSLFSFWVFQNLEIKQCGKVWGTKYLYMWTISNSSPQLLQVPSQIKSYIKKREQELMQKFSEQLEEKTQMLQADLRAQQDALDIIKEQLKTLQDSKFQVRDQFHVNGRGDKRKVQSSTS